MTGVYRLLYYSQELDSMIAVSPLQLGIFCQKATSLLFSQLSPKKDYSTLFKLKQQCRLSVSDRS